MIETISRRVVLVCAFLTLLIPFVVSTSMFFPYITGKAFLFRLLVEVMLGAWAVLTVFHREYRPRWSPVMVSAFVFLGVVGIADVFGINPMRSFWSNFERMEGYLMILHVVAYLMVMGTVMRGEKIWNWFLNCSVAVSVALSFGAFGELVQAAPGQNIRVDATLGNSTYFAVFLLFNIFIALILLYRRRSDVVIASMYGSAVVLQLIAMYYTQTRGAILGVLGGMLVGALMVALKGREYPTTRKVIGVGMGTLIVVGVLFFVFRDSAIIQQSPTLSRFAHISLTDTTVQSRLTLWTKIGWNAFQEHPVLGWGQDNFIVAFGKYYDPIMYKQEPWFDRAHNVFVDWAIAGGLLGLLAYLALFGAGIWMLAKSNRPLPEKALIAGLFVAYAINNSFVFDNLVSYLYFAIVLAYLHAYESITPQYTSTLSKSLQYTTVGFATALTIVGIWMINVPSFARAHTLINALQVDYSLHDARKELPFYQKALSYGRVTGLEEVREQLSQSAVRSLSARESTPEGRTALGTLALQELSASALEEQTNTRRLYFLAHFLRQVGQSDKALAVFDEVLAINPLRQNFIYEKGQIYLDKKDYVTASNIYKQAYEVQTENDTAFGFYAATLMYANRFAEGEALLIDRFGTTTVDNDLLFKAYDSVGRNDKLAAILELRLHDMAPADDAATRVSLGMLYLDLARPADAIAQLERAIQLEPRFADQGAQMIQAIKEGKKIKIAK